jgi:hypothetical protein
MYKFNFSVMWQTLNLDPDPASHPESALKPVWFRCYSVIVNYTPGALQIDNLYSEYFPLRQVLNNIWNM